MAPTEIRRLSPEPELMSDHCSGSCEVITPLSNISTTRDGALLGRIEEESITILNLDLTGVTWVWAWSGSLLLPNSILVFISDEPPPPPEPGGRSEGNFNLDKRNPNIHYILKYEIYI
jgi:hypothetical protein